MAVNKYGNDFKNNIMWNKEYPFIPEVTNDYGFTIHEGDIVDYYDEYDKKFVALRVYKIYSEEFIWTKCILRKNETENLILSANEVLPYTSNAPIPKLEDFDNQDIFNDLEDILGKIYADKYPTELDLPDDWHFDDDKFESKRLEEVAAIKGKY